MTMNNAISSKDLLDLAENLKSLLKMCEIENSCMLEILSKTTSTKSYQLLNIHHEVLKACGDDSDNSKSKKSGKTDLDPIASQKERLSMLIKDVTEENLRLRESNVKLKQESKMQDKKIRDLNHKTVVYERNNHEKESQRILLRDLKSVVAKKAADIELFKQKLENMKALVSKEESKTKIFQEHQRKSPRSKINRQLKCKVGELLKEIDLLLEETEQGSKMSYFKDKNCFEKTLKTLKKLVAYSTKLNKDEQSICKGFDGYSGNDLEQNSGVHLSVNDVGTQTSDETVFEEGSCKKCVASNEDEM